MSVSRSQTFEHAHTCATAKQRHTDDFLSNEHIYDRLEEVVVSTLAMHKLVRVHSCLETETSGVLWSRDCT